jgi:hypothetical protein
MHPDISYELATARIAGLRRRAQRVALARAASRVPARAPQPGGNRILVNLRRAVRQRRFSKQLWTLLHAQVLLEVPADAAGNPSMTEGNYRPLAARRNSW